MLLEALIAILIFSMGVLAIVGMQVSAMQNASDAKYRSDANMLANQLIGQMWTSNRNSDTLKAAFQGGGGVTAGASYTAWSAQVTDLANPNALPGAAANPPQVAIDDTSTTTPGRVTIQIFWMLPNASTPHKYVVVAQIK